MALSAATLKARHVPAGFEATGPRLSRASTLMVDRSRHSPPLAEDDVEAVGPHRLLERLELVGVQRWVDQQQLGAGGIEHRAHRPGPVLRYLGRHRA